MGKDIVLVYTSSVGLPEYVNDSVDFILSTSSAKIHFICNEPLKRKIRNDSKVSVAAIEELDLDMGFESFVVDKYGNFKDDFYTRTASRFLYLSAYANIFKLHKFWHFEVDNLIFSFDGFSDIYDEEGFNIGCSKFVIDSPNRCVPSCIWFSDDLAASYLAKHVYNNQGDEDMLSLFSFFWENRKDICSNLPIYYSKDFNNPELDYSNNFKGSIFDGAALGQYLFGIDRFDPGESIKTAGFVNESCAVDYKFNEIYFENGIPYISGVKVNNLHVHSKNIKWAIRKINS